MHTFVSLGRIIKYTWKLLTQLANNKTGGEKIQQMLSRFPQPIFLSFWLDCKHYNLCQMLLFYPCLKYFFFLHIWMVGGREIGCEGKSSLILCDRFQTDQEMKRIPSNWDISNNMEQFWQDLGFIFYAKNTYLLFVRLFSIETN